MFVTKNALPLQSLKKQEENRYMNITTLNNLAVLHIIRVVVVTWEREKVVYV